MELKVYIEASQLALSAIPSTILGLHSVIKQTKNWQQIKTLGNVNSVEWSGGLERIGWTTGVHFTKLSTCMKR